MLRLPCESINCILDICKDILCTGGTLGVRKEGGGVEVTSLGEGLLKRKQYLLGLMKIIIIRNLEGIMLYNLLHYNMFPA